MFEYKKINDVVKDVDLEAMPTSIFLNDGDDDCEDRPNIFKITVINDLNFLLFFS